jgi:hypothetical protein
MAMTWGQVKAVAVAAALPDTAPVILQLELPAGTVASPVPGYVASSVEFQKSLDVAVVAQGKLIGS